MKAQNKGVKKFDWIIHYCANGIICADCGKVEYPFLDYVCNAHTHGMEKYGHPDFQIVLQLPQAEIAYILNELGSRVRDGAQFQAGDLVERIFLDCLIRLDEAEETGRKVLRAVIPDKNNLFPEEKNCMEPCKLQLLPTEALYRMHGVCS